MILKQGAFQPMNIVSNLAEWQALRRTLGASSIGFIPTMGYLHAGHLSLCERSRAENDISVVSIFVNPTQFNQAADLEKYPRDLQKDIDTLTAVGVDYVLCPNAADMYPDDYQIQIYETSISQELEGQYRPGHFTGMLSVVLKLLNLVQATRAYFGEKDYQQLLLVKKMAQALFLPVEIIGVETMRAEDQLPLSSRNSRLSATARQQAAQFPAYMHDLSLTPSEVTAKLTTAGFRVDYIAEKWHRRLGAVWLDDVRLIDNILLKK